MQNSSFVKIKAATQLPNTVLLDCQPGKLEDSTSMTHEPWQNKVQEPSVLVLISVYKRERTPLIRWVLECFLMISI